MVVFVSVFFVYFYIINLVFEFEYIKNIDIFVLLDIFRENIKNYLNFIFVIFLLDIFLLLFIVIIIVIILV